MEYRGKNGVFPFEKQMFGSLHAQGGMKKKKKTSKE